VSRLQLLFAVVGSKDILFVDFISIIDALHPLKKKKTNCIRLQKKNFRYPVPVPVHKNLKKATAVNPETNVKGRIGDLLCL
jgi:hypothetical protein